MTKTLQWFRFYHNDWSMSPRVRSMSLEARGFYLELLIYCWNNGCLDVSTESAKSLVRVAINSRIDRRRFDRLLAETLPCFAQHSPDIPGIFVNPKLELCRKNSKLHDSRETNDAPRSEKRREDQIREDKRRSDARETRGEPTPALSNLVEFKLTTAETAPIEVKPSKPNHREVSERILLALNSARKGVISGARDLAPIDANLKHVTDRLKDGYTEADCLHVIEVSASEVRADAQTAKWFDQVTPFRADNFAKRLASQPRDLVRNGRSEPKSWSGTTGSKEVKL